MPRGETGSRADALVRAREELGTFLSRLLVEPRGVTDTLRNPVYTGANVYGRRHKGDTHLWLSRTHVTDAGLAQLKTAPPCTEIRKQPPFGPQVHAA